MGSQEHIHDDNSAKENQSSGTKNKVESELTKLSERTDRDPKKDMETVSAYENDTKFSLEERKFLKTAVEEVLFNIINKHYENNDLGYYTTPFNANNRPSSGHLIEYAKYSIGFDQALLPYKDFEREGHESLFTKIISKDTEKNKLAAYMNAKYRLLLYGAEAREVQKTIDDIYKRHNVRIRFLACSRLDMYTPAQLLISGS